MKLFRTVAWYIHRFNAKHTIAFIKSAINNDERMPTIGKLKYHLDALKFYNSNGYDFEVAIYDLECIIDDNKGIKRLTFPFRKFGEELTFDDMQVIRDLRSNGGWVE